MVLGDRPGRAQWGGGLGPGLLERTVCPGLTAVSSQVLHLLGPKRETDLEKKPKVRSMVRAPGVEVVEGQTSGRGREWLTPVTPSHHPREP